MIAVKAPFFIQKGMPLTQVNQHYKQLTFKLLFFKVMMERGESA